RRPRDRLRAHLRLSGALLRTRRRDAPPRLRAGRLHPGGPIRPSCLAPPARGVGGGAAHDRTTLRRLRRRGLVPQGDGERERNDRARAGLRHRGPRAAPHGCAPLAVSAGLTFAFISPMVLRLAKEATWRTWNSSARAAP